MKPYSKQPMSLALVLLSTLPAFAIEAPKNAPVPPVPSLPAAPAQNLSSAPNPQQETPNSAPRVIGYLGMGVAPIPSLLSSHLELEKGKGVTIKSLDPTGPAALAGLAIDDIILQINNQEINNEETLSEFLTKKQPREKIELQIIHGGEKPKTLEITLGKRTLTPTNPQASNQPRHPNERLQKLLASLPPEQAQQFREALQNALQERANDPSNGGGNGAAPDPSGGPMNLGMGAMQDPIIQDIQRQLQAMFSQSGFGNLGGFGISGGGIAPSNMQTFGMQFGGNSGGNFFQSQSTARILDSQGSVEVRSDSQGRMIKVFDPQGKEEWSGPWNKDEDRKAAPTAIRERIEQSGISADPAILQGNSSHMNILRRLLGK